MKRFLYLFLSGIALLTACQNNPSKQTDKDIQNIDSIKQETKADSIKQTANIAEGEFFSDQEMNDYINERKKNDR